MNGEYMNDEYRSGEDMNDEYRSGEYMNDEYMNGEVMNGEVMNGEVMSGTFHNRKGSGLMNKVHKHHELEERLIDFAVQVCEIAENLPASRVGLHAAGQLIRSGTSPAANYGEAQGAESRRDFVHKMKICLKELKETHVWLRFIKRMNLDTSQNLENAQMEGNELISIFVQSVKTAAGKSRTHDLDAP